MSKDHIGIRKELTHSIQFSRMPDIVLIAERDQIRGAEIGRLHEVCAKAESRVVDLNSNWKTRTVCKSRQDLHCFVRGGIIRNDEFSYREGLVGEACELL